MKEMCGTLEFVCMEKDRQIHTHTHAHTHTHRRNCSRKVASVQPIRQGFSGPVQAFYIWWSAAGRELEPGVTFERKH